ncbi:hypothetical protein Y592_08600 [Thermosipho sp. 1070]|nr:hypothetical protein Y592_08600 [Thermosipho sp. 1070]
MKKVVISSKNFDKVLNAGCTGYFLCGSCKEGKLTP